MLFTKMELCGRVGLVFALHLILVEKLSSADVKTLFFVLHLILWKIRSRRSGGDFVPHSSKRGDCAKKVEDP